MEDTEQRGPGIENGSEWSNGMVHFDRTGPTEKSGPPRKVDHFFRNFSGWTEPIHSELDRNFRKFWLNGSRPLFSSSLRNWCSPYHTSQPTADTYYAPAMKRPQKREKRSFKPTFLAKTKKRTRLAIETRLFLC